MRHSNIYYPAKIEPVYTRDVLVPELPTWLSDTIRSSAPQVRQIRDVPPSFIPFFGSVETVTIDKWQQSISQPQEKQFRSTQGSSVIPTRETILENITIDKWWQSAVRAQRKRQRTTQDLSRSSPIETTLENITMGKWWQSVVVPKKERPFFFRSHLMQYNSFVEFIEVVIVDGWWQPVTLPPVRRDILVHHYLWAGRYLPDILPTPPTVAGICYTNITDSIIFATILDGTTLVAIDTASNTMVFTDANDNIVIAQLTDGLTFRTLDLDC